MYQFDPAIAIKYGINEAIMYQNIVFWCMKNKANEKHFHHGYYRTYNSKRAFTEIMPFWTERQIRNILESMVAQCLIKKGCYNENRYDQTLWYTPSDQSVLSIGHFCPIEQTEKSTHYITDNKPHKKTDDKEKDLIFSDAVEEKIKSFIDFRKQSKSKMTDNAVKLLRKDLKKRSLLDSIIIKQIDISIMRGYKGVFEPKQREVDKLLPDKVQRYSENVRSILDKMTPLPYGGEPSQERKAVTDNAKAQYGEKFFLEAKKAYAQYQNSI